MRFILFLFLRKQLLLLNFLICIIICISCKKEESEVVIYDWKPMDFSLNLGQFSDLASMNRPFEIYFIDHQTGFISYQYNNKYELVRTDDSCITFIDITGQIDGFANQFCFPDKQTGFLVTDEGSLYKTENRGETWDKFENCELIDVIKVASNFPSNLFVICRNHYGYPSYFLQSTNGGIN